MSAVHWEQRILNSVVAAAQGDRKRLVALAHALDEADIARDSLIANGFGELDDGLLDLVALVVEGQGHDDGR